ncbi:hypothetical protein B9Z19DRAFT_1157231 [Tuber borchii]|uniref:Extracellular membrane protein CFEM domain-containing protein n=1 Tax=Tuber borchii TaxID=42251 RepID=A0A2T7A406_TUBBO|nr:hypothetical protein B9Z19DRAFT_1157231 [Tuber borchii]
MIDPQLRLAGGILCLICLISPLTSVAGGALQPRAAEVDFSKMPECSSKICTPILGSLLSCGQSITLDCFCGKPNPLICAWTVNWDCWNRTEDWYDSQCPGKPLVDLTGIPECARSCFDKANVCKVMTSNCVCSQPKPDCSFSTTTCKAADVSLYDAWYTKSCKYNLTTMTTGVSNPSATASSTNSTSVGSTSPASGGGGGRGLSKGAIAGVAIGVITGALVLGFFLCSGRKQKDPDQGFAAEAPPSLHEMDDSWNLKARHDLSADAAQSVPLVEAPG